MGCDIHWFTEIRDRINCPLTIYSDPDETLWQLHTTTVNIARNADLFSILTEMPRGNFTPIFSSRGLPKDISKGTYNYWSGFDYHSPSFLSGEELLELREYQLNIVNYVSLDHYSAFEKDGIYSFPYPSTTPNTVEISESEMERRHKLNAFDDHDKFYYMKQTSRIPASEYFPGFFKNVVGSMLGLVDDPKDVRAVFWFDD